MVEGRRLSWQSVGWDPGLTPRPSVLEQRLPLPGRCLRADAFLPGGSCAMDPTPFLPPPGLYWVEGS